VVLDRPAQHRQVHPELDAHAAQGDALRQYSPLRQSDHRAGSVHAERQAQEANYSEFTLRLTGGLKGLLYSFKSMGCYQFEG